MKHWLLIAINVFFFGAAKAADYPMMDGNCSEYAALDTVDHQLDHGVTLHLFQDAGYVWACYTLPADSYGTLDLVIDAPNLDESLNLHVSAQLGEWPVDNPDAEPQSGDSPLWWNNEGWFSNVVNFNGYVDSEDEERRANFRPSTARELQLSKDHFGRGTWTMSFNIFAVSTPEGRKEITFPENGALEFEVK